MQKPRASPKPGQHTHQLSSSDCWEWRLKDHIHPPPRVNMAGAARYEAHRELPRWNHALLQRRQPLQTVLDVHSFLKERGKNPKTASMEAVLPFFSHSGRTHRNLVLALVFCVVGVQMCSCRNVIQSIKLQPPLVPQRSAVHSRLISGPLKWPPAFHLPSFSLNDSPAFDQPSSCLSLASGSVTWR